VLNGRKGVGAELQPKYYRQALLNLADAAADPVGKAGEFQTRSMEDLLADDQAEAEPPAEPAKRKRKAKAAK
jgi:hypothetical protein